MKKYTPDVNWFDDFNFAKSELSKISPTFCLAKWLQSTIHFHLGKTHSCHHPPLTSIDLNKVRTNPSALHNTDDKLDQRLQMLNGQQPAGCDYCWRIENLKQNLNSDRVIKSSSPWSTPHLYAVADSHIGETINPTYLEVSFSNECQFKCSYCSADFSSKWQEEINKFGPYSTGNGSSYNKLETEDSNEYIKYFWQWWPELVKHLHVFRITGGEPLLSKNTFLILEDFFVNSYPQLGFAVNSNLGIHEAVLNKFISKIKFALQYKKIKSFTLFTSIDTFSTDAEYIRHGLNFTKFQSNVNYFLSEVPDARLTFMVTFNIFSAFKFIDLLKWITELRKNHQSTHQALRIGFDINYLRHPELMSAELLPKKYLYLLDDCYSYMVEYSAEKLGLGLGFLNVEIDKIKNLIEWLRGAQLDEQQVSFQNKRFVDFFTEHDKRRNTDFKIVFPELADHFIKN